MRNTWGGIPRRRGERQDRLDARRAQIELQARPGGRLSVAARRPPAAGLDRLAVRRPLLPAHRRRATSVKATGPSRGLLLRLDQRTPHCLRWRPSWARSEGFESEFMGDTQPLAGGTTFVGWGSERYFSEYDRSGKLLFEGIRARTRPHLRAQGRAVGRDARRAAVGRRASHGLLDDRLCELERAPPSWPRGACWALRLPTGRCGCWVQDGLEGDAVSLLTPAENPRQDRGYGDRRRLGAAVSGHRSGHRAALCAACPARALRAAGACADRERDGTRHAGPQALPHLLRAEVPAPRHRRLGGVNLLQLFKASAPRIQDRALPVGRCPRARWKGFKCIGILAARLQRNADADQPIGHRRIAAQCDKVVRTASSCLPARCKRAA